MLSEEENIAFTVAVITGGGWGIRGKRRKVLTI